MTSAVKTGLALGAGALLLYFFKSRSRPASFTNTPMSNQPVNPGSTIGQVSAGVGIFTSLASSFKNLFSGTSQPLTSGAPASNPADYSAPVSSSNVTFESYDPSLDPMASFPV